MDYYSILGVNKQSTPEEIKKAYRKLASQHHPDKGGDVARFQEIEQAYRILSDPSQKEQYDLERQGGGFRQFHFNQGDFQHADISDIFKQFGFGFGGGNPFGFHQQQQQKQHQQKLNQQKKLYR